MAGELVERPERVQAAFDVFRGKPETGPNATAIFLYIEALERENATLCAERNEARNQAIEEAAKICDRRAKYFRGLSTNPDCLTDIRWNSPSEARQTMQSYAVRHETDASAIRNIGGEG